MKQIVYILSSNFSGSHFLSLMIGSHSRLLHIGEIKWLEKVGKKGEKVLCAICGDNQSCPVFQGISPENIENVYETIFQNVGPEVHGLVDASKKTRWAERFLGDQRYEIKVIHLIRDPRALVRRWFLDEDRSVMNERRKLLKHSLLNLNTALFGNKLDVYVGKWLRENKVISDFIGKHRLDAFTVTYHDLVMKQEDALKELMQWLGYDYEHGQADYWNFIHHGTVKSQYQWVNEKKTKFFDCRWKDFLSDNQQLRVENNQAVKSYLRELNISMVSDGLTSYP